MGVAVPAWRAGRSEPYGLIRGEAALRCWSTGLRKTYTTESGECDAVRGVSLALEAGEFVAIVGRSGSGKSTLLAMLGGLCRPTSGAVAVMASISGPSEPERAAFRNREVGLVFQFASLLPTLRVIDNVALPAFMRGVLSDEDAYRRATELLDRVGLGDRAYAYPSELSGGEQRARPWRVPSSTRPRSCLRTSRPVTWTKTPRPRSSTRSERYIVATALRWSSSLMTRRSPGGRTGSSRSETDRSSRRGPDRVLGPRHLTAPGRVPDQDRGVDIPAAAPPARALEASARLGAGLGAWMLSVAAWVVPAHPRGPRVNQGVALYQRHLLHQRRQARAAMEDSALLWLRAEIGTSLTTAVHRTR